MCKSTNSILALIPFLKKKMALNRGFSYRVVAAAYSKHGNLLGIEMNGWRELTADGKGKGKHAEAALIKKFGRKIDKIYILRFGRSLEIRPIHPCECCLNMSNKIGIKIIPIHEMLNIKE